jgi:hypothetical protein
LSLSSGAGFNGASTQGEVMSHHRYARDRLESSSTSEGSGRTGIEERHPGHDHRDSDQCRDFWLTSRSRFWALLSCVHVVLSITFIVVVCSTSEARATGHAALVIAAEDYSTLNKSEIGIKRGQEIADALKAKGFEVVLSMNPSNAAARAALGDFAAKAQGAELVVVVLLGHGVASNGQTFFLPTNATIEQSTDLLSRGLSITNIAQIAGRAKAAGICFAMTIPEFAKPVANTDPHPLFEATPAANVAVAFSNSTRIPLSGTDLASQQAAGDVAELLRQPHAQLKLVLEACAAHNRGLLIGKPDALDLTAPPAAPPPLPALQAQAPQLVPLQPIPNQQGDSAEKAAREKADADLQAERHKLADLEAMVKKLQQMAPSIPDTSSQDKAAADKKKLTDLEATVQILQKRINEAESESKAAKDQAVRLEDLLKQPTPKQQGDTAATDKAAREKLEADLKAETEAREKADADLQAERDKLADLEAEVKKLQGMAPSLSEAAVEWEAVKDSSDMSVLQGFKIKFKDDPVYGPLVDGRLAALASKAQGVPAPSSEPAPAGFNISSPDDLASMKVLEALLNPNQVRRIQSKLAQMGLYEGPIDAVIGTLTRQAIKSFQRILGKPDTGYLSLDQVRLLTTVASEPQSTAPAN